MEGLKLNDCWLAGGAIRTTIWNYIHNRPLYENIKDLDVLYYDELKSYFKLHEIHGIPVEIRNQAYVHDWYKRTFNIDIPKLKSVEDGLKYYPDNCSTILIRLNNNDLEIKSLYPLDSVLNGILYPNIKRDIYKLPYSVYLDRLANWNVEEKYPKIRVCY